LLFERLRKVVEDIEFFGVNVFSRDGGPWSLVFDEISSFYMASITKPVAYFREVHDLPVGTLWVHGAP